ncbi:MAG: hypothetical protein ACXW1D_00110 [Halobacteriota archaeon]
MGLVRGIGSYTKGKYPCSVDSVPTRDYRTWYDMLRRCTCESYQQDYPNYVGCTVDETFLDFQNFMLWAEKQPGFNLEKRHLDKDFLQQGVKTYHPDFCVFIPPEVNTLFGSCQSSRGEYPVGVSYHIRMKRFQSRLQTDKGRIMLGTFKTPEDAFLVYKKAKEEYAKYVAGKYKDVIDHRVYDKLMSYEVNIND